jgi:hypothetical protein
MNLDDLIQFLARTLLKLPHAHFAEALEQLKVVFPDMNWETPRKVGAFSVAGVRRNGEPSSIASLGRCFVFSLSTRSRRPALFKGA